MPLSSHCAHPFSVVAILTLLSGVAHAQQPTELVELSLEELMTVKLVSASRKEQAIGHTAAAAYVITEQTIRRSGASNVPDLLRMVPGFSVARLNANAWSVTSRGSGGIYANKLLVMIDGRSIYIPSSGGVYWELLLLPLDTIKQIEIVRGPGGSLWGANAINGIVNIITKSSNQAEGNSVTVRTGPAEPSIADVTYGGHLGKQTTYAASGRYSLRRTPESFLGITHADESKAGHAAIRVDHGEEQGSRLSLRASFTEARQRGLSSELAAPEVTNTPGRQADVWFAWTHPASARVENSVQAYYSHTVRGLSPLDETLHLVDVEARQRRTFAHHELVAGAGFRASSDKFDGIVADGAPAITVVNRHAHATLFSAFAQDEIQVVRGVFVTPGIKIEHHRLTGFEAQPSLRALWSPADNSSVWAAATRAVRTPNLFELDLQQTVAIGATPEGLPIVLHVEGDPAFQTESLRAIEAGYRWQHGTWSIDATTFTTTYDNVSSTNASAPSVGFPFGSPALVLPATLGNFFDAESHGFEVSSVWTPDRRWSIAGHYAYLSLEYQPDTNWPDAHLNQYNNAGVPTHQWHLRSTMSLPYRASASAAYYRNSRIVDLMIPAYNRLDLKLEWNSRADWSVSLGAQNLLHDNTRSTPKRAGSYRSTSMSKRLAR
jgi:iron complex outermembrane receptor protein